MGYVEQIDVRLASSRSTDAFGRLRISQPVTLFDSTLQYDLQPLQWEDLISGAPAAVTHTPNSSAATLTTGAVTSGAYAYRQSRQYIRYQPGKSQLVLMTGVMGAAKANVRQRIGYFDDNNGLFFETDGTSPGLQVVRRTNTSGSPVDTKVVQASWNIDKMNGTGVSGITLDMSKTQIFVIDLQWLGVGRVVFGFEVNGILYPCHEILNANSLTLPYMTTANLPIRYAIENTGTAASSTDMLQVCCAVISEGGFESDRGYHFAAANGITAVNVTTRRAVLSMRPAATLNSIAYRGLIELERWFAAVKTNDAFIEIVYNPTYTTPGGLTWTAVDSTNSGAEYCIHADAALGAITGGVVVDSLVVEAGSGANRNTVANDIRSRLPVVLDKAGSAPRGFAIVATSFTGTATVNAGLGWKEVR